MPSYRKSYRKTYNRKYRTTGPSVKTSQTVPLRTYIKRTINQYVKPERKILSLRDDKQTVPWGGWSRLITAMGPGLKLDQFTGRSVNVKKVLIKGNIVNTVVDGTPTYDEYASNVRIIVYKDRNDGDGIAPDANQLLDHTSSVLAPNSFLNLNNRGRFQILYSKLYTFNQDVQSRIFNVAVTLNKGNGQLVSWGNDPNDLTARNHIYLLMISDKEPGSNVMPITTSDFRVYFEDA